MKKCKICGKEFEPRIKTQVCCSPECSNKNKDNIRKKHKNQEQNVCPNCGKTFWGHYGKRYCSKQCKMEYHNSRRPKVPPKEEEPTVANTCPKGCQYRSKTTPPTCDYILITGKPRGGDVTTCTVCKIGPKKRVDWQLPGSVFPGRLN